MKPIKFQQQKTNNGCVSACLAMLTEKPFTVVYNEFHEKFHTFEMSIGDYLKANGIEYDCPSSIENQAGELLEWGYIYLVTVPSVNRIGLFHYVIVDCRISQASDAREVCVIDPARHRSGCKYYTHDSDALALDNDAVYLESWIVNARLLKVPVLEYERSGD